ncbi:MAG: O-methyltransferase [Bacteroidales bacterium]|nr:O-methyltransferase [Bacteroidales bacterium]
MNIDPKIEKYIIAHTEPEDELLKELDRMTNLKILRPRMLSGHLQGEILKMISYMIKPKKILEIGTFTGYSAICLAKGLNQNGKLYTIDKNDEIADFTKSIFEKFQLNDKIFFCVGDAMNIIPEIDEKFDLVFIDADKREYLDYYKLIFDKVNKGGFIIADNVLWDGKVIEKVDKNDKQTQGLLAFNDFIQNDNRVENVMFPIRDGLMIMRKK